ncbi:Na+-transporting NADH:ubiquinone oxidoreductase electron transport complex protein RnfD [Barnesiella viscericola DSM 18177]|uniref:Ion-translocating oxidoreductase complex subunit D n=1 Tax=Barnesiella viscericola DSM 18177 TaxID=880074 RepID=W0ERF0_9BACT|nr:RnfABCDGE type electron transport complex subunit D [Barnesiella viscericola]AHF11769.1 Na+-transporting NADH:ubiquinone oxidoreductase electron transport complex protein RnfD [Barnesiella viscericola DSM 18177]
MELTVSPAPHIHGRLSASQCMYSVIIALLPAFAVSLYFFGVGALIVTLTSILSCIVIEYLIQKFLLKEKPTIGDGSAILTGLLLGFNLPSNLPIWIVIIGSVVAIGITKMAFGGLGNNLFNPALAGRVFLLISFPTYMTQWPLPVSSRWSYTDAETGATLLSKLKEEGSQWIGQVNISDLWIGNQGGSLGEVGAIALLIGFAFLLYRRIISWHIPVSILATVFVFSFALGLGEELSATQPAGAWQHAFDFALIQLLSGGLLLGAIYMATDYVTSPMTSRGMVIYGIGIGLLTVIIRQWGGYPEGVSFAILIMNAFTPLINNYIKPKRYGRA